MERTMRFVSLANHSLGSQSGFGVFLGKAPKGETARSKRNRNAVYIGASPSHCKRHLRRRFGAESRGIGGECEGDRFEAMRLTRG